MIHHHFGSKEDLYAAVKRRLVEGYARRFPGAARATNRPLSVRAEMRRIMTYLGENPALLRLCLRTRLEGDNQVWPGEPDLLDTLRRRIEAVAAPRADPHRPRPGLPGVMIFGLIFFWVENRDHFADRFAGSTVPPTSARPSHSSSEASPQDDATRSRPPARAKPAGPEVIAPEG